MRSHTLNLVNLLSFFTADVKTGKPTKVQTPVKFTAELKVPARNCKQNLVYKLFSVVCHHGD
eukprot:SAG31_NODE_29494_length_394_cov_1.037288_1_plen_61_part_01